MIQTPFLAVDGIVQLYDHSENFLGIILIERKNPPHGWAFPGGFVDIGESVASALIREMEEEITLKVEIEYLQGLYSDPKRDPRFHTVSAVFVCRATGFPEAADDAGNVRIVTKEEAKMLSLAFDHFQILSDFLEGKRGVAS